MIYTERSKKIERIININKTMSISEIREEINLPRLTIIKELKLLNRLNLVCLIDDGGLFFVVSVL